jgi:hypothetical protein
MVHSEEQWWMGSDNRDARWKNQELAFEQTKRRNIGMWL